MRLLKLSMLLILFLFLVPRAHGSVSEVDWYLQSGVSTVNGVTGYALNTTQTASAVLLNASYTNTDGYTTSYWSWRVYKVDSANESTELTSDYSAVVSRSANGLGYQSATWTCPETSLICGLDSLKLEVYMKLNDEDWLLKATFTSGKLWYAGLEEAEWTFNVWTNHTRTALGYFYRTNTTLGFGISTYGSSVTDILFQDPDTFENQGAYFYNLDFIGFIMAPWTFLMGADLFTGALTGTVLIAIALRTRSLLILVVFSIILGGSGGFLTMMLPAAGYAMLTVCVLFAVAGIIYMAAKRIV